MLQYIATPNDRYTIAELAQMAIEGGCKWIILRAQEMSEAEIRELAMELIPLCKETGTIFTIENHLDLAKDLSIHGVLLTGNDVSALQVRESFGPEAIIGVQVGMASSALSLINADVDYVAFEPGMTIEQIAENVKLLQNASFNIPIVAQGKYGVGDIPAILGTGVQGIAESEPIASAEDPVKETEAIINAIAKFTNTGK